MSQSEKGSVRITEQTRLNKALDLDPRVVDYIVSLSPHKFERLRNPLMRRLMSPRITLGRMAEMVHMPVEQLLDRVAVLGGVSVARVEQSGALPQSPREAPSWVTGTDPATIRTVDLLSLDEALSADPMPPVTTAIKALASGEALLIKHKWEPQPFYDVWNKMGGLEWFSAEIGPDEWWIWVRRTPT